ncbi:MAG: nucleoside kinase [Spirochaetaceae bacterium]|jgi:uridine kinase|nr:nucleoside kinase [Spirochaetaceae bacterium]
MGDTVKVFFPGGKTAEAARGTPVSALAGNFGALQSPLAAVKMGNRILPLSARLEINSRIEPVCIDSPEGADIYRRSLAFLLSIAARELFPGRRLVIGHSLGHSYYYSFQDGKIPGKGEIESLGAKMLSLAAESLPVTAEYLSFAEAEEIFRESGQADTLLLLERQNKAAVQVNVCRGHVNLYIGPLVPDTGMLSVFELMAYEQGILLRFPGDGSKIIDPFADTPRLFSVYREYKKWGRIVGLRSAGELNRMVTEKTVKDFIRIAEAFQEKKLNEIADSIYQRRNNIKAILLAGPSSSGKTTTAKRLSIDLMVMGIKPIAISLDDYYGDSSKTPLDENGRPDYECLEALDVPYLNRQLLSLFNGEEVTLPVYDFKTGRRKESGGRRIRMERRSVLIIEGIHGLNDRLTGQIDRGVKFKLYVSALTQLGLDECNRIPTTDNRLLRRIVRDSQFRGVGASWTIRQWPSVQRGAWKHIFSFQDSADEIFNSALDYEIPVLKFFAEPLLRSIRPDEAEYPEAFRLLSFLDYFAPISPHLVPGQSILREFIGGSEFKY